MMRSIKTLFLVLFITTLSACIQSPKTDFNISEPPRSIEESFPDGVPMPDKYKDIKPIHWPSPNYPRIAAEKGLEGWVALQYDVGVDGRTKNIIILDSSPKDVFDRLALKAVKEYRYKPALENGELVEMIDISNVVNFIFHSSYK